MRVVTSADVTQGAVIDRPVILSQTQAAHRRATHNNVFPSQKFKNFLGAIGAVSDRFHSRLFPVSSNETRPGLDSGGEDGTQRVAPQAVLQYNGAGVAQSVTGGTQLLVRDRATHRGIGGRQGAGVTSTPPLIPIANPEQGREGNGAYNRAPHLLRFGMTGDTDQMSRWGQYGTPLYNQEAQNAGTTVFGGRSGFSFDYSGLETGVAPTRIPRQHRFGLGAQAGLLQHGTQQSWDFMTTGKDPSGNGTGILTPRIGRGTEASRAGFRAANNLLTARSGRPDSFATVRIPSVFVPRSV